MIPFDNLVEDTHKTFKTSTNLQTHTFRYGQFNQATLNEFPVMPDNIASAQKWRNKRMEEWLQEQYVNTNQFQKKLREENSHEAFSFYNLQDITIKDFLESIKRQGKTEKSISFWHLAAAYDLNPV